ncbi:AAA family ATPase [Hyphomonas oceanitis]|uniref:ATPase-like protein n=1 Tax=Hyphomonas oceanitis SCH89 TaxID=1280953 RepID=A0A059G2D2_9PROT|nr:AAA family ATPase [Hyphomonas oceanitis]KDA00951.1 ATPase-like protein [Hyphomonas oceanitis SCH89]
MIQSQLLPELQEFHWAGRDVNIVFDSDIAEKARVQDAETRLATELSSRGARIFKVRLPHGHAGEKIGVDDYLLTHSADELVDLINATQVSEGGYKQPIALQDLIASDYPPTSWTWQDFILKGEVNLLYGDGGVGKSLLALHAAIAVSAGEPLCGRPTQTMPVLGLFAEDGEAEMQRRVRTILHDRGLATDADLPIRLWCQPGEETLLAIIEDTGIVKEQPRLHALRAELASIGQPAFVILDGFADLFALNESLRLPVNAALKRVLGGLCRDFGATVLVLAHPSKASMADGTNYSGSTAFNNGVRQRLNLELATIDRDAVSCVAPPRILKVAKSNYGALEELPLWFSGYSIDVKPSGPVLSVDDERSAVLKAMLQLIDRGVRVINRNGAAGDARTLQDFTKTVNEAVSLSLPWRRVKDHLRYLVDDGQLAYREADKSTRPHVKAAFVRGIKCPL